MSKVHLTESTGRTVTATVHYLVPAGNNSADISWKNILARVVANGLGRTEPIPASSLTIGTGYGQITQAEYDQIVAGDVVEFSMSLDVEGSGGSAAQILPQITAAIAAHKTDLAAKYRWYGRAEGTVN